MNTTTINPKAVTAWEKAKKIVRVTSITIGTVALLAYVSLLAVIIIL